MNERIPEAKDSRRLKRFTSLSLLQARRIALEAQGFGQTRPGQVTGRRIVALVKRLGLLQIDSVNVLVRAHFMPIFSRLGPYPMTLLDKLSSKGRGRAFFEYWGHAASLIPLCFFPLFRWRMQQASEGQEIYSRLAQFGREQKPFIEKVYQEVRQHGPVSAGQLERLLLPNKASSTPGWWNWSEYKTALEWLFWAGRITTSFRKSFERMYDLTERVLPHELVLAPQITGADAQRELIRMAVRALGVATERDLRDYFWLSVNDAKARVAELVEAGDLLPVTVEAWRQPAFLDPAARIPRRLEAQALVSPFDPLIWERARTERLFGFRYRIEIYTPAHKREHGYYVLPFLLGDRFVARVDLKADRATRSLQVTAAHTENGCTPGEIVPPLLHELKQLALWIGLEKILVFSRGDLAGPLKRALGASRE
jgi:uncharacterized protein YcaQ